MLAYFVLIIIGLQVSAFQFIRAISFCLVVLNGIQSNLFTVGNGISRAHCFVKIRNLQLSPASSKPKAKWHSQIFFAKKKYCAPFFKFQIPTARTALSNTNRSAPDPGKNAEEFEPIFPRGPSLIKCERRFSTYADAAFILSPNFSPLGCKTRRDSPHPSLITERTQSISRQYSLACGLLSRYYRLLFSIICK